MYAKSVTVQDRGSLLAHHSGNNTIFSLKHVYSFYPSSFNHSNSDPLFRMKWWREGLKEIRQLVRKYFCLGVYFGFLSPAIHHSHLQQLTNPCKLIIPIYNKRLVFRSMSGDGRWGLLWDPRRCKIPKQKRKRGGKIVLCAGCGYCRGNRISNPGSEMASFRQIYSGQL